MQQRPSILTILFRPGTLLIVYVILAVFASIQIIATGGHPFTMPVYSHHTTDIMNNPDVLKQYIGHQYYDYNNYIVFRQSFLHLLHGKDLYTIYPAEQWDLYKYSPTFALFMAPLNILPDMAGLICWNLLNALVLFAAISMLPFTDKKKALLLLFIALELLISMQNAQSNALLAGLMIAAFGCLERRKMLWAALWLVLATFIKVYGAIGFCLFLFYPDKLKFILYSLGWTIIMALLPLTVIPAHTLIYEYKSWAGMMAADQSASYGLSVMGWLHSWFGLEQGKNLVSFIGTILFLLPLFRFKLYKNAQYRLLTLASILIWVVIFNHKAESPTFIITLSGVGIWHFSQPAATWRKAIMIMALLVTCLSVSDLIPHSIRQDIIKPYAIKAVPSIIIWCVLFIQLMALSRKKMAATAIAGGRHLPASI
ncbi:MAG: DUF2029 domain-containing protein [Bacteroidetes bacterium]|nr:DUF2029 domain-containing protein [Bacteroidota bacterium]